MKRVAGDRRRTLEALETEVNSARLQNESNAKFAPQAGAAEILVADLLEGFASKANPTRLAPEFGLVALEPADIKDGIFEHPPAPRGGSILWRPRSPWPSS